MARSKVVTVADILSGLAPGKLARTTIVGISACGKAATGGENRPIYPIIQWRFPVKYWQQVDE
jgi:hypothetical protein